MQNKDSSKSRDSNSSSSMNTVMIDYCTPIRTRSESLEFYSSTSTLPNHITSSSSGVNSRSSSPNSSIYLTPHTSFSSSSSDSDEENYEILTEYDRLYVTRVILPYDQSMDQYGLCYSYLKDSSEEVDFVSKKKASLRRENAALRQENASLRQENAALRLINKDLKNESTEFSVNLNDFSTLGDNIGISTGTANGGGPTGTNNKNRVILSREAPVTSPTSVFGINDKGFEGFSTQHSAYLKMNQLKRPPVGTDTTAPPPNKTTSQLRASAQPFVPENSQQVQLPTTVAAVDESQKVGVEKEVDPVALDLYKPGMPKTELCDKWQQTGVCPYGVHCRFAHGAHELRRVIHHAKYRTEVCSMFLTGGYCRFGHRCHFRHALTDQENA